MAVLFQISNLGDKLGDRTSRARYGEKRERDVEVVELHFDGIQYEELKISITTAVD